MSRAVMQQALEALEYTGMDVGKFNRVNAACAALRAALAEPEQEPVAWISEGGDVSRSKRYMDEMGFKCEPLYTAPPQREHITNGSPCWCNPDVIEEDGGDVIVHNYDDNWQQYAKPGETAQQCIERHRAEQDALMKLYTTPRKPQTTHWEGCEAVHPECRKPEQEPVAFCNGMPAYEGTLSKAQRTHLTQDLDAPLTLNGVALYPQRKPLTDEEIWNTYKNLWMFHPAEEPRLAGDVLKFARAIERAHGITGDSNE